MISFLRRVVIASPLTLAAACAPAANEGWFSLTFMNARPDRGPVQVLAYFVRPPLGTLGMNDDVVGCVSLEEDRAARARRLVKATEGSFVTAGVLTVTPHGGAPRQLRLASNQSAYSTVWEPFFVPNQAIDVRFSGDDTPAFAGTLVAPSAISLIEPPCPPRQTTCPAFDRSRDLVVRWNGAGHGFVRFDVITTTSVLLSAHCTFDARTGQGVIPQALIPPSGDVRLWVHSYAAAAIPGARGSMLHLRVDAPSAEWTFAATR